jgi:sarcosine oxidase subunit delta
MAFLIPCPNCGERGVIEFRFGGELNPRPAPSASTDEWTSYIYRRGNTSGVQTEWWYHRYGCRKWFLARRDTTTNQVMETRWP